VAHRTFTDPAGAAWHVWDTYPSTGSGRLAVAASYAGGWLCFERVAGEPSEPVVVGPASGLAKRRLAPIPAAWAEAADAELHALLAAAQPVAPRATRARSA
jgi:hypothetical protein